MRRMRSKFGFVCVLVAMLAVLGLAQPSNAALDAVGPIDPANGFPFWYRDTAPLMLQLCLDNSGFCLLPVGQTFPITFPANFPDESFYWNATADANMATGGRALLVLGLEATFNGGVPLAGDQIVFARLRIRIDVPVGGTYTVVHPFGTEVFNNVVVADGINITRDIGIGAPGDFTGALNGDIGPFLTWDPAVLPAAPAGYIGDPNVLHTVVGSPTGNNLFRVVGPAGSNLGGNGNDTFETNLFSVSGKIATIFGVTPNRFSYTRNAAGNGNVDGFAKTVPAQTIQVTGVGTPIRTMIEDPAGSGNYFGRFPINPRRTFSPVTVSNITDLPVTDVTGVQVVDVVRVLLARYLITDGTTGAGTLTVRAFSSDAFVPPTLSVESGGVVIGTLAPVLGQTYSAADIPLTFPPESVTVSSSAGGSTNQVVIITGPRTP